MATHGAKFIFSLIILSIGFIHVTKAQSEYIVVEKTMTSKQIKYSSGDQIVYKLKEEDFFRTDYIVSLNDTSIEFHYSRVRYWDITQVNIKGKKLSKFDMKSAGGKIQIAGIALIAIDQFNQVVIRGEDASFNEGIWIIGGSIFVGGTLMRVLNRKVIKLGGKYRIRYMNLNN